MVGHTDFATQQLPNLFPYLHDEEQSSFQVWYQPSDTVNSKYVVGLKTDHSSMVIRFQVDEFTHTLLMDCLLLDHKFILGLCTRCQP